MPSTSSHARPRRSSSTQALNEGRHADPLLNGNASPTHSPSVSPSSSNYGISVTPRGAGSNVPSFARFESGNVLSLTAADQLSSTPSARRGQLPPRANLDKDTLRALVFDAVNEGDLDKLQALILGDGEDDLDDVNSSYPSAFEQSNWVNGEGETPLHRACYKGHLHIAIFLENSGANVEVGDNDGWTPLMNAASRGYLDVVRWLVEDAGAMIDRRSKHGYTALSTARRLILVLEAQDSDGPPDETVNAAARGHLPVTTFLATKHRADPLLRNEWGDTASDLAASVFEVQIFSVLVTLESAKWASVNPQIPFNPLSLHSTVPVILHENQRLARPTLKRLSSLGTLATGQPLRWSAKALSRNDNRTAFTMPCPPGVRHATPNLPVFRSEVGLPVVGDEARLQLPPPRQVRSGGRPGLTTTTATATTSPPSPTSSIAEESRRPTPVSRRTSASSALTAVLTSSTSSSSPSAVSSDASATTPSNTRAVASARGGSDPAWFWLSDWTVDLTEPRSSPVDGWSYAPSFDSPEDAWSSEVPEDVQRSIDAAAAGPAGVLGGRKYVRRRRWVRIMRRRLDLPDWGYGVGIGVRVRGVATTSREDGGVDDLAEERGKEEEEEEEVLEESAKNADYLVRAQFLARASSAVSSSSSDKSSIRSGKTIVHAHSSSSSGSHIVRNDKSGQGGETALDKVELRKAVARLERAVDEIRRGTVTDENVERRRRAEDQLETYLHQMALVRAELGPEEDDANDDEDSDEEFIYSGRDADPDDDARSTWTAAATHTTTDNPRRPQPSNSLSRSLTSSSLPSSPVTSAPVLARSLTSDLSRASEFRVPTHETSAVYNEPRLDSAAAGTTGVEVVVGIRSAAAAAATAVPALPPVWEPDEAAQECRRCARKFSFFNRKHHCRRCGLVCCHSCTTHLDPLDRSVVVRVPGNGNNDDDSATVYRTCDACHAALSLPLGGGGGLVGQPASYLQAGSFFPGVVGFGGGGGGSASFGSGSGVRSGSIAGSVSPSDAGASDVSELSECPVCGTVLAAVGSKADQEDHVRDCLETGAGSIPSNGRYLVFNLPAGPLVSEECKICFVEFEVGDKLARLPCLCCFHHTCIRSWMDRGKTCPFHASRD